ncbi:MAG: heparinase II/III family protein, partial [Actinomycetota bacterium]
PLASTRHLDVRPTLLMAAQLLDGATYDWGGPAEEAVRWFWGEPVRHLPAEPEPEGVWTRIFPHAGISIIVNGRHRALIRGGEHQLFRPPQCDFGHVELWVDGEQTMFDLGSSSYKPKPGEPDYSETQWHNLPWPEGEQIMTRLGRFLWGDWPSVRVDPTRSALMFTVVAADGRSTSRSVGPCLAETWVIDDSEVAPDAGAAGSASRRWLRLVLARRPGDTNHRLHRPRLLG